MRTYVFIVAVLAAAAALSVLAQSTTLQPSYIPAAQPSQNTAIGSETTPRHSETIAGGGDDVHRVGETSLSLVLDIPVRTSRPGAEIVVTVTLANTGSTTLNIEYFIGQLYDIIIKNSEGRIVYRSSETTPYRHMLSRPLQLTLSPGETSKQEITVKLADASGNPLPPGKYTATAYLLGGVEKYTPPEKYGLKASAKSNTVEINIVE
ncbi:MAG: BsuPI-related putative proteinase inhibitor [Candidatus Caldarchaeum sp.]